MRQAESKAVSGRFLLRLPARVHARLQATARGRGLSLNEYCTRRLSVPGAALLLDEGARAAIDRSLKQFSGKLLGVLVFGSYARGDAAATSDVDLLVVIDRAIPLTRALYREWDVAPPVWAERSIDPHFVHLPTDVRTMPGAWCEAAIDGVVLFEREGALTRRLAAVRGDIATGRLVRRSVHGQPYWTVAA
jgi:hypothetical protein